MSGFGHYTVQDETRMYDKRILLAVTGLSPQIVTETIYALAVKHKAAPTEVHVLTTEVGAQQVRRSLLNNGNGWFHRLCDEYQLAGIVFNDEGIHPIKTSDGTLLNDIRTIAENTQAADSITDCVRQLTLDKDSALHASIAGGRKTMGFFLGYALSLFGREQDRLSHVLVSAPYESHPEFFYPSQSSELIYSLSNGQSFNKRDAEIALAEIPFVRMRDGLDVNLLNGGISYSDAVAVAQRILPPVCLTIDVDRRVINTGGQSISLSPIQFALYWMLAERAQKNQVGICRKRIDEFSKYLLRYYREVVGESSGDYEHAENTWGKQLRTENWDSWKSHINGEITKRLGERIAPPYLITALERIPNTRISRYGLSLDPQVIHIVKPDSIQEDDKCVMF